jgi:hypothetical protein
MGTGFWNLNITEPIGANWQYYCGPPKGVWLTVEALGGSKRIVFEGLG